MQYTPSINGNNNVLYFQFIEVMNLEIKDWKYNRPLGVSWFSCS